MIPRGSKYPIFEASGCKNHILDVFATRVLKCWVLGPSGLGIVIMALGRCCIFGYLDP